MSEEAILDRNEADQGPSARASSVLEQRSIEFIPLDERRGRARELFGIWFGFNMIPLAMVTGAVGIALGLPLVWTIPAIILGNLLGGLTMGLHATQGPHLGVPQMLQARGQFGSRGAGFMVAAVLIVMLGYFSSNLVVSTQALRLVFPEIPTGIAILVSTLVSLVVTVFGYRIIRVASSIIAWVVGGTAVLVLIIALSGGVAPAEAIESGTFTAVGFFTVVMVAASWQVGYAPYVSDYSRYLPRTTGVLKAFWGTYGGCTCGAILMMSFGAYLASRVLSADPLAALSGGFGAWGAVVLALFFAATAISNAVNSYTASLCTLTLIETFRPGMRVTAPLRYGVVVGIHLIGFSIATVASDDFLTFFLNFIAVLMYLLIPWSAINLADYFFVEKGHYDIDSFFTSDGGVYGRWNVPALAVYLLGILVQLPFMNAAFFVGPAVEAIGGVDIAWIIGFVVSGLVYTVVGRSLKHRTGRRDPAAGC